MNKKPTKNDALQRFIFDKTPIRGEYVHLQESFHTIVQQHQYPPAVRKLLGEALCVATLLSAIIKFDGRLTVQFRGKGKLKLLLAQCDNQFHLRGLAKYEGTLSYEDLMDAFNEGVLAIMLDSGANKNRYQGVVGWRGNSFAESIEGYFEHSEQLATKIILSVDDKSAAGLLLQVMPGSDKEMTSLEKGVIVPSWERINHLVEQLEPQMLLHLDYQTLLRELFPEEEIRIFPETSVSFQCTCSRKRSEDAIEILGRKEAEEEIKDKQVIVVTCDFCNKEYVFDRVDIEKIFSDKENQTSGKLH